MNFISLVCAYKSGPHQSTQLRLCMNSSMKQPQPAGKSLNDLLMKGPPALADLFSVTLGMHEHKYAIAKDLSKFYNCVQADPVAQHTCRVVWHDGDLQTVPKVYCTSTVNFGDKPAGCIAIAAIKETADLGGDGEAAYFSKITRMWMTVWGVQIQNLSLRKFQKNWKKLSPKVALNSKKLI